MTNPHIRQAIREYVKTRLLEQTDAEDRVYNTRLFREITSQDRLPLVNVLITSDQQAEIYSRSPSMQMWVEAKLEIEAVVTAPAGLEFGERLDRLCGQIESRIDYFLGGLVNSCLYGGTQLAYNTSGDVPLAIANLSYTARYLVDEQGLPVYDELPDFLRCHFDWDMAEPSLPGGGPDGQIDARDDLTLGA